MWLANCCVTSRRQKHDASFHNFGCSNDHDPSSADAGRYGAAGMGNRPEKWQLIISSLRARNDTQQQHNLSLIC
jgi:hypothetical protein